MHRAMIFYGRIQAVRRGTALRASALVYTVIVVFIAGLCAAQNNPPMPLQAKCVEVAEECYPPLTAYEAAKMPIHIEPPASPAPAGSVSVTQLRHKPKKAAQRAVIRGINLFDAGEHEPAAAEFRHAIQRDFDYAYAHDWLGVEYTILGRFDEARGEFEHSIALDPNSWSGHYDFATLLSRTGDSTGAQQHARCALALSGSNPHIHLLVGLLLWPSAETRAEGVEHLRIAARTLPQAKELLSKLQ